MTNPSPNAHLREQTYDFLQLVRLPGNWPAGRHRGRLLLRRLRRLVDRSRRFALLVRHDDDDGNEDEEDAAGLVSRLCPRLRRAEKQTVRPQLLGGSVSWTLQRDNHRPPPQHELNPEK